MSTTAVSVPMPAVPRRRRSARRGGWLPAPVDRPEAGNSPRLARLLCRCRPRGDRRGKTLEHYGVPVYVRKEIVHNVHVVCYP